MDLFYIGKHLILKLIKPKIYYKSRVIITIYYKIKSSEFV